MSDSSKAGVGTNSPRPLLFDIGLYIFSFLAPIFFFLPWDLNMAQGWFFVFGTFALWGLSFFCERQRDYKNKWLGAVILWSLAAVFIHSYKLSIVSDYAKSFANFALMSEGFIYILCGAILYWLVISYRKVFRIEYPILAINIFNLLFVILQLALINPIFSHVPLPCGLMGTIYQLKVFTAMSVPVLCHIWLPLGLIPMAILGLTFNSATGQSFNALLALFIGVLLFVIKRKNIPRIAAWSVLGIGLFGAFYKDIIGKIFNRFEIWSITVKEIIRSPLWGWGFDNSLNNNMVELHRGIGGYLSVWSLRQNDYLNIARDLGLPFLAMVGIIIYNALRKTKLDWLWLAVVILALNCFWQTSFYYPRIAVVGVILLALKESEKWDGELRGL